MNPESENNKTNPESEDNKTNPEAESNAANDERVNRLGHSCLVALVLFVVAVVALLRWFDRTDLDHHLDKLSFDMPYEKVRRALPSHLVKRDLERRERLPFYEDHEPQYEMEIATTRDNAVLTFDARTNLIVFPKKARRPLPEEVMRRVRRDMNDRARTFLEYEGPVEDAELAGDWALSVGDRLAGFDRLSLLLSPDDPPSPRAAADGRPVFRLRSGDLPAEGPRWRWASVPSGTGVVRRIELLDASGRRETFGISRDEKDGPVFLWRGHGTGPSDETYYYDSSRWDRQEPRP